MGKAEVRRIKVEVRLRFLGRSVLRDLIISEDELAAFVCAVALPEPEPRPRRVRKGLGGFHVRIDRKRPAR